MNEISEKNDPNEIIAMHAIVMIACIFVTFQLYNRMNDIVTKCIIHYRFCQEEINNLIYFV